MTNALFAYARGLKSRKDALLAEARKLELKETTHEAKH